MKFTYIIILSIVLLLCLTQTSYSQEDEDFETRVEGDEDEGVGNLEELRRRKRLADECSSDSDCGRGQECAYVGYSLRKACQRRGRLIG
ncbi:unnamed protein product [Oppiella nova]|uniref:Uncharacterized protein n=1 Tax=Oppiella nova TaxID=334625 RepID=A0A7R9MKN2_9ACAR|nr:unnamed protein product [Oppiella nova]CAG2177967.1 unnamed protein product [Oppiella nova]